MTGNININYPEAAALNFASEAGDVNNHHELWRRFQNQNPDEKRLAIRACQLSPDPYVRRLGQVLHRRQATSANPFAVADAIDQALHRYGGYRFYEGELEHRYSAGVTSGTKEDLRQGENPEMWKRVCRETLKEVGSDSRPAQVIREALSKCQSRTDANGGVKMLTFPAQNGILKRALEDAMMSLRGRDIR